MRRAMLVLAVAATGIAVSAVGGAQTPTERPFPSSRVVQFFVSTQTVNTAGELTNFFPRGSAVVFRGFAGASKSGRVLTGDDVKFFYVAIPGQPNLKLQYTSPERTKGLPAPWPWTATWTIPADFPLGVVRFRALLKAKTDGYGSFVQIPVATSQLTVTRS